MAQAFVGADMIDRILIALDGSEESEEIFKEVERVAGPRTTFDLLHILENRPQEVPGRGLMLEEVAREYLERIARRFTDRTVRLHLRSGEPEREIPRAARTLGADLLALTTHARRGLSRLLMGSVAEAVVRKAKCPVLTVKHPSAVPAEE